MEKAVHFTMFSGHNVNWHIFSIPLSVSNANKRLHSLTFSTKHFIHEYLMRRNYVSCENVIYTIYHRVVSSVCALCVCVCVFYQLQIRANICKMCRTWLTCLKVAPKKSRLDSTIQHCCDMYHSVWSYISLWETVLCGARIFSNEQWVAYGACLSRLFTCASAWPGFICLHLQCSIFCALCVYTYFLKSTITTMMMMMMTTTTATIHTPYVQFHSRVNAQSHNHTSHIQCTGSRIHTTRYIVYSTLSVELFEFISCAIATVACCCSSLWHMILRVCVYGFLIKFLYTFILCTILLVR